MDLVINSPNPNSAMGSDSIEVDSSTATVSDTETVGAVVLFHPRPSEIETEDVSHSTEAATEESVPPVQNDTMPASTPLPLKEPVAVESAEEPPAQVPPPAAAVAEAGLQIVTRRKRSCVTAAAAAAAGSVSVPESGGTIPPTNSQQQTPAPTSVPPATTSQPPKKKKKYIPKPKKPAGEAKAKPEPKPRPTPKPKAPKKPAEKKSQSKSKKIQQQQQSPAIDVSSFPESCSTSKGMEVVPESTEEDVRMAQLPESVAPVLKPMPKLKKMPTMVPSPAVLESCSLPIPLAVHIKEEPQEWDDNDNTECEVLPSGGDFIEEPQSDPVPVGVGEKPPTSSRKKKSKGRNGNIYIGVFNRIEWMKLQEEFGFQTVNNFGTFVLQTMRRVHGDIQFWCDVAKASGVYPDLSHYEWKNGFPHATNKEGHHFTPDPEAIQMSVEKSTELGEMARRMWDERLELLKQQQQEQQQEGVPTEVVTVPDDVEEVEEEDVDDPGLENYLENMASGQYLPASLIHEEGNQSTATVSPQVTVDQVNRIWSEQANNPQSLEIFGKLISFVNGIQSSHQGGEQEQETEENEMEEVVEEAEDDNMEEEEEGEELDEVTDPVQLASVIIEEVSDEESMQIDETVGGEENV